MTIATDSRTPADPLAGLIVPEWWPGGFPPMPGHPIEGPAAWMGEDMAGRTDWIHHLSPEELREIDAALEIARPYADDLTRVDVQRFPLPSLAPRIARIRDEVLNGRGFALLRGLSMERYTKREAATVFWGIGRHIGEPRSQNGKGHLLGHIRDLGFDVGNPSHRGYQTTIELDHHTDSCDIAGLICLRAAREGGISSIVSSVTIHNEMLRTCPDLLRVVFEPFFVDRRGEIPAGKRPYYLMPVYHWHRGLLSAIYASLQIHIADRHPGVPPLTSMQKEALAMLHRLAEDPRLQLLTTFRPGDMQFVHNHTVFHARTAYIDWEDDESKRHLLRLWLCPPDARELPPSFAERYGSVTVGDRGGIVVPGVSGNAPLSPL
jgi:hypothetical protein